MNMARDLRRFGAECTDGGADNVPPSFFGLAKERARYTVQKEKRCPRAAMPPRGDALTISNRCRANFRFVPAAPHFGGRITLPPHLAAGVEDSGGYRLAAPSLSALSASLSAAGAVWEKSRCVPLGEGNPKGRGRCPAPLSRFKGVRGETAEEPPEADAARRFRGSGTIGGHEQWPGIVSPRRWADFEIPPGFSFGGTGAFLFSKEKTSRKLPAESPQKKIRFCSLR